MRQGIESFWKRETREWCGWLIVWLIAGAAIVVLRW